MFAPDHDDTTITEEDVVAHLILLHGRDTRTWRKEIPAHLKLAARSYVKRSSLCLPMDYDSVRGRVANRISGLPAHITPFPTDCSSLEK